MSQRSLEMFFHFFKSFADGAKANLNIKAARIIKEDKHRINEKIRATEVRLVGDNVAMGVYPEFRKFTRTYGEFDAGV